jgi:hypothetical protein
MALGRVRVRMVCTGGRSVSSEDVVSYLVSLAGTGHRTGRVCHDHALPEWSATVASPC